VNQIESASSGVADIPTPSLLARVVAIVRSDRELLATGIVWILFVVNFNALRLASGDEQVQYQFVQRLFGDVHHAVGYYFGLGIAEAPFYAVGKLLRGFGLTTVRGNPVEQAVIALGLGLSTIAVWPLSAAVLRGLRLRHAGSVILAAVLGTPFFYYATFVPGKDHALDATLFTAVVYLTYRYLGAGDSPDRWIPGALGVVLGFSYTVRYFSGAEAVVLVPLLCWWRRWRHASEIAVTSAVVCLALFLVPRAVHVPVFAGANYSAENVLVFAPLNPLRMLFTDHRGLFVWSPVTVLATVGLVLLFRHRPEHRRFLTAVTAMAVGLISAYALVPFWDGTWSFSQRFFTPLLPVIVIGLAGLVDALPRTAAALATVTVAWSLFLALNLVVIGGPQYESTTSGGATDLALVPYRTHTSLGAYLWGLRYRSLLIP
jgi:hypothetical protein